MAGALAGATQTSSSQLTISDDIDACVDFEASMAEQTHATLSGSPALSPTEVARRYQGSASLSTTEVAVGKETGISFFASPGGGFFDSRRTAGAISGRRSSGGTNSKRKRGQWHALTNLLYPEHRRPVARSNGLL